MTRDVAVTVGIGIAAAGLARVLYVVVRRVVFRRSEYRGLDHLKKRHMDRLERRHTEDANLESAASGGGSDLEAGDDLLYEEAWDAGGGHAAPPDAQESPEAMPAASPAEAGIVDQPRYANVEVINPRSARPMLGVRRGQTALVRSDIGALRRESLDVSPVAFPDLKPRADIVLEVLFSSADFEVGLGVADLGELGAVQRQLLLPAGGHASRVVGGTQPYVEFAFRAGAEFPARGRLSYVYRNTVLQSQRLDIASDGALEVRTDFTISDALAGDLSQIRERPRVAVVANQGPGSGQHQLVVRAGNAQGAPVGQPVAFAVPAARLSDPVDRLRKELERRAPTAKTRRRQDLIDDLRRLAPLGWSLYNTLDPKLGNAVRDVMGMDDAVLQIALAQDSTFTAPWAFVYDIYLPDGEAPEICPVVKDWDGSTQMVQQGISTCPHSHEVDHRQGLLCPFGFWGFRFGIEILPSTDHPKTEIRCKPKTAVVIGRTNRVKDKNRLDRHLKALRETVTAAAPTLEVHVTDQKRELQELILPDLPVLYFLCHGEKQGNLTVLSVGNRDRISAKDITGWLNLGSTPERFMWTDPQPFVFINACESLAIAPTDLLDYLTAFVGRGRALGVVGTEVRVEQGQAMDLAEEFFRQLFEERADVETALRRVRLDFLAAGNLVGLNYTPYCFADLSVAVRV